MGRNQSLSPSAPSPSGPSLDGSDDGLRIQYWAILSPSPRHSVAYLESPLATAAAAELECGQYLVLVEPSRSEHFTCAVAYVIQSAQLPLPVTYVPILPCRLGTREPLAPDFDWPFGECVVDTSQRLVFEPVSLGSDVNVPRAMSEAASLAFAALSDADDSQQLREELLERRIRRKTEREAAGLLDDDGRWTTFSLKSTVPDTRPGQFSSSSISAQIHYDIKSLRGLLPASQCFSDVKNVERFRARFSRLGTERTILWTMSEASGATSKISEEHSTSDFEQSALWDFSTTFERPISPDQDAPVPELVEDLEDDPDDWWGGRAYGISHEFPAPPVFEPQSLQLIYFDVYGTLIDSESGIFCALGPLLARSSYDFDRREALSMYLEVESELKRRVTDTPYSEILAKAHQAMALRLGLTSTPDESSAFASSLIHWPLFDGAVQALHALHSAIPNLKLVVIADMDVDTLYETSAFPIISPFFGEIWSWDLCHTYRPDPYTFSPAVIYHDGVGVLRSQRCLISNALFERLEFGCQFLVPAVWMRNPAGLAAGLPSADASFVWRTWRAGSSSSTHHHPPSLQGPTRSGEARPATPTWHLVILALPPTSPDGGDEAQWRYHGPTKFRFLLPRQYHRTLFGLSSTVPINRSGFSLSFPPDLFPGASIPPLYPGSSAPTGQSAQSCIPQFTQQTGVQGYETSTQPNRRFKMQDPDTDGLTGHEWVKRYPEEFKRDYNTVYLRYLEYLAQIILFAWARVER
ncbi:hypothetical protein C8R46DRAFT_1350786 [Mycena filopes]|nr:hypothetical protein C8R46DRAFT_1350786 [Mycena filopes]